MELFLYHRSNYKSKYGQNKIVCVFKVFKFLVLFIFNSVWHAWPKHLDRIGKLCKFGTSDGKRGQAIQLKNYLTQINKSSAYSLYLFSQGDRFISLFTKLSFSLPPLLHS